MREHAVFHPDGAARLLTHGGSATPRTTRRLRSGGSFCVNFGSRGVSTKAGVCTIIAKNYLAQARVLMESVRLWNPELRRIVIVVDRIEGCFDPSKEPFDVVLSEDLNIPKSKWFHFKYTLLELSTAVKPYALEFFLHRYDLDKVLYLDPDIKVYASLQPLLDMLDRSSVVVTPHLTDPLEDDLAPSELDILRCGTHNLGFIGISGSPESHRFLKWWQRKLYDLCVVDPPRGLFVDQRWMDFAPSLFAGVAILRKPGYNVAYWNLNARKIDRFEDGFTVNGEPLYFFHFSGFDPKDAETFSRHQTRFRLSDLEPVTRELVLGYRDDLLSRGFEVCRTWPYAYGRFSNGFLIPDIGRPLQYESDEITDLVEDPFSEEGYRSFVEIWNQPIAEEEEGEAAGISRLMYRIYGTRADVQDMMPDIFGGDRYRFLQWVLSRGKSDLALNNALLAPIWDAVEAAEKHQKRQKGKAVGLVNGVPGGLEHPEALDEPIVDGHRGLKLTRLARVIYQSRPELQRIFPDPCGRDGVKFLVWILTYGKQEHLLTEPHLAPLRSQWGAVLASLDSHSARMWYRLVLRGMSASVVFRNAVAGVSSQVARSKARFRERPHAQVLRDELHRREIDPVKAAPATRPIATGPMGLNLVGHVRAETGVGESARAARKAAAAAGIPVALKDIPNSGAFRSEDQTAGPEADDLPYGINVFHVNADQTEEVFQSLDPGLISSKYNIGFWHWELDQFPVRWLGAFDKYQEIWTSSTFCQEAIARVSPLPVVRIPHCIDYEAPLGMGRDYFGLPSDRFLFVTLFDMLSIFDRKNPLGTVEAFIRAFGADPAVQLIVKINHSEKRPGYLSVLKESAAGYPITIIDRTFRREETYGLINTCDCLVSMHRSEGFGLTLAEAMYLGKPVIATAYSGNMDFTRIDSSFLVGYRLKPVGKGNEPYDEHCLWADPSVEQAAEHMRTVARDAQTRQNVATAGQEWVRSILSPRTVGRQMEDRLKAIRSGFGRPARSRAAALNLSVVSKD
jgi:glycosyltransferase involved in cell wall biosynthesis